MAGEVVEFKKHLVREIEFAHNIAGPPPDLVHGGYATGCLVEGLQSPVRVVLKAPTKRQKTLKIVQSEDSRRAVLYDQGQELIVAETTTADELHDVPALSLTCSREQAELGSSLYDTFRAGAHPGCYCCGIDPSLPDLENDPKKLNVSLGQRSDAPTGWLAGLWEPPAWAYKNGRLNFEDMWAALDCPGWHAWRATEDNFPPCFLGTIVGEVLSRPSKGAPLIVCVWPIEGGVGRKRYSGVALIDHHGNCVARAQQVWIKMKS